MSKLEIPITVIENFIYCLEVVPDADSTETTEVLSILEDMAVNQHVNSEFIVERSFF